MKTKKQNDVFICDCHSPDHNLIVLYDEDEYDGKIYPITYLYVHLNKKGVWKRLRYGIRYIFGYQCRYGAFDEFIFNPDDADKSIIKLHISYLNKYKKESRKFGSTRYNRSVI